MNIKEGIQKMFQEIVPPPPSNEWVEYTLANFEPGSLFSFYGKDPKTGDEKGRVTTAIGRTGWEKSFHITKHADNSFEQVNEGIFPYSG